MTATYDLINSTVLTSSASSITISSIPSTYRDLIAVVSAESSGTGGSIQVRFNGDASNYSDVIVEVASSIGINTTSGSGRSNLITSWLEQELGTVNSTIIYQIIDYSATDKHKTVLTRWTRDGVVVAMAANRWSNTSVIDTILFTAAFAANSRIDLYGIVS